MLDINEYKDAPLFAGIIELNERLQEKHITGIELNVIGGFAMMVHGYRDAYDGATDIDYVGPEIAKKISDIAEDIGEKLGLLPRWINNDNFMTGLTLEDYEFATGKLHFQEAFDLENIKVNILESRDLLKLKVIALDNCISCVEESDKTFRYKDFDDIVALKKALNVTNIDIKEMMGDLLVNARTIKAIKAFEMGDINKVDGILKSEGKENDIGNWEMTADKIISAESRMEPGIHSSLEDILSNAIKKSGMDKGKEDKHCSFYEKKSSILNDVLDDAIRRSHSAHENSENTINTVSR